MIDKQLNKINMELPREFLDLCQSCGIDPVEVLHSFIADLCGLEGCNGSDERDLAEQYFDRVGYNW